MSEVVERMKAGAVMVERSPLKEAIDWIMVSERTGYCDPSLELTRKKEDQLPFAAWGTAAPSFSALMLVVGEVYEECQVSLLRLVTKGSCFVGDREVGVGCEGAEKWRS